MAGRPKTRAKAQAQAEGRQLVVADDTDDVYVRVLCRRVRATGVIKATAALGGLIDLDPALITHVEEAVVLWAPRVGDVVVTKLSNRQVTVRRIVDGQYVIEYVDRSTATVDIQDIERLKI